MKWIVGDRLADLHLLMGRKWDAVIDTCGYRPQDVEASCAALYDSCERYVFISSVSAYASFANVPIREQDPLATAEDVDRETINGANYGPLKAECERTVARAFGQQALLIRPGLIVGPNDPTGRFSYWPWRICAGGRVLAPGSPETPIHLSTHAIWRHLLRLLSCAPAAVQAHRSERRRDVWRAAVHLPGIRRGR